MENTTSKQEVGIFKPLFVLDHAPIDAYFSKNSDDFVVREVPLYEFNGDGEHLVLEISKKDMTTMDAIKVLSDKSGAKMREFGYAGLKDKDGYTTQFISLPAKFEKNLENFAHENMKILSQTRHKNKIRVGHLAGNHFFIRLKKVGNVEALKLEQALKNLDKSGFANYYGEQRFGRFEDNAKSGLEILKGERVIKNPKVKNLLISAYQSELFNRWLSKRVEISKFARDFSPKELVEIYKFDLETAKELKSQEQFFKLLRGDVLGHYPFGKQFICEDLQSELKRFQTRDTTICGLMVGKKALFSEGVAKQVEDEIYKESFEFANSMEGTNRYAWVYIKDLEFSYDESLAHFKFSFYLEKGSYATTVLREVLHS
ncbi:MAG: tRNA pseudouridine(13) synthase TruD [Campylobacteraceae bacterium]|nr:tRNA pseudouridine(13) synthase TruD [Campylobacteraceae bacterium]